MFLRMVWIESEKIVIYDKQVDEVFYPIIR